MTEEDEDAVLAELDELIDQEEKENETVNEEKEEEDIADQLPDVPSESPEKVKQKQKGITCLQTYQIN